MLTRDEAAIRKLGPREPLETAESPAAPNFVHREGHDPFCTLPAKRHRTRREFIKAATTTVGTSLLVRASGRAAAAQSTAPTEAIVPPHATPGNARLLLRGGTIITMDPRVGDFSRGDVLIEGSKILAIGPNISGGAAHVIDASGTIVIPGFVDAHRHAWEGQLRRINPNAATLNAYNAATHDSLGLLYRPRDMYVGTLITALGCIDSGITCVVDNCNNTRSAAHSDEAIRALFDSGIRAVHASGPPHGGDWDHRWPSDLARLKNRYFRSSNQLVTLAMFSGLERQNWEIARSLGLRIHSEVLGSAMANLLEAFWTEKLLASDNTFNHCGGLLDTTWEHIRDSGVTVDVCPRSDSQYALSDGASALQAALDYGVRPGLSIDNETAYGTDMFSEMHVAFHLQRSALVARRGRFGISASKPITVRQTLELATINGAHCAGLSEKIGTLMPGKEADIVLIRTDGLDLYPANNAFGTVVAAATSRDVETVIIGGAIRKLRGTVVGADMPRLRADIDESRTYLFQKAGYTPNMFAEDFAIDTPH